MQAKLVTGCLLGSPLLHPHEVRVCPDVPSGQLAKGSLRKRARVKPTRLPEDLDRVINWGIAKQASFRHDEVCGWRGIKLFYSFFQSLAQIAEDIAKQKETGEVLSPAPSASLGVSQVPFQVLEQDYAVLKNPFDACQIRMDRILCVFLTGKCFGDNERSPSLNRMSTIEFEFSLCLVSLYFCHCWSPPFCA